MGEYDFTYKLPDDFDNRLYQHLKQQPNLPGLCELVRKCHYDYEVLRLAYYEGLRGDNWDKKAIDFTFEGSESEILAIKSKKKILEECIKKSLKSNTSGLVLKNIYFIESLDSDFSYTNDQRLSIDIVKANKVLKDLDYICEMISKNRLYNQNTSEDSINDCVRDMFILKGYTEVKDQTRHGISFTGKSAGEVDILLSEDGHEIAIIEALKLTSLDTAYINKHIEKAIINYNPLGTATFILAYINVSNYESFWFKYVQYLKDYKFLLESKSEIREYPYTNASTRVARKILSKDGYDFPVYFVTVKLSQVS